MSAYIGGVTFTYPLQWVNKNECVTVGSKARTRSGDLVVVSVENPNQKNILAKCKFEWTPKASVDTLRTYWRAGTTYSADIEGTGTVRTVRFDPDNGVVNVEHESGRSVVHAHFEGQPTDLYRGELNLIIETP